MIGIDTNVLVRYLTQDEPTQAAQATLIIEQKLTQEVPGFIGVVVLVETVWVLQRLYAASTDEIRRTVADLLGCQTLVIEQRDVIARALSVAQSSNCGFADAVIAASALGAGCREILSFDRRAVRAGMKLVEE